MRIMIFPVAAVLCLMASAAPAQQATALTDKAIPTTQATVSPEEARAALNRQQAEAARHQFEQNAASQRAVEAAEMARAKYAEQQAAYEAEKARVEGGHVEALARWQADMVRWKADDIACNAGHARRCAPKKPERQTSGTPAQREVSKSQR